MVLLHEKTFQRPEVAELSPQCHFSIHPDSVPGHSLLSLNLFQQQPLSVSDTNGGGTRSLEQPPNGLAGHIDRRPAYRTLPF
mgnify:CR=1 FL=1